MSTARSPPRISAAWLASPARNASAVDPAAAMAATPRARQARKMRKPRTPDRSSRAAKRKERGVKRLLPSWEKVSAKLTDEGASANTPAPPSIACVLRQPPHPAGIRPPPSPTRGEGNSFGDPPRRHAGDAVGAGGQRLVVSDQHQRGAGF